MPELPEVETTTRYLRQQAINQLITGFTVTKLGDSAFNAPISQLESAIVGHVFSSISRQGKFMLFEFEGSKVVGHLRMSGRYLVSNEVLNHPHNRFQLHLQDSRVINYIDQRRFGTFHLVEDFTAYPGLQRLGPDALSTDFTAPYLDTKLKRTSKPIYSALLDQNIVAGLGNIYVNEVLHAAGIHPLEPANSIPLEKLKLIVSHTNRILNMALAYKGTTLIDNLYQDPEGNQGTFYNQLQVYGRKHHPEIAVLKIGGRSAFVHNTTPKPTKRSQPN